MYLNGNGVERSPAKAMQFLREGRERGDAKASTLIGLMYMNGNGVEQNVEKARELLQEAQGCGDDQASTQLGVMYLKGNGNPNAAIHVFKDGVPISNPTWISIFDN